jgi:hypothetical protein
MTVVCEVHRHDGFIGLNRFDGTSTRVCSARVGFSRASGALAGDDIVGNENTPLLWRADLVLLVIVIGSRRQEAFTFEDVIGLARVLAAGDYVSAALCFQRNCGN